LRQEIKKGLAQLAADGRQHYHPVEPEARRMKLPNGTNRFAYNAQALADEKEGVILACEATRQETDSGQLVPLIQQAQQNVGPAALATTTLADAGYGGGADLQAAAQEQKDELVPPSEGGGQKHPYAAKYFHYDASVQTVTCPRGQKLDYQGQTIKRQRVVHRYRCHCRDCPVRVQCTADPKGRQIEIWPHTTAVQAMRKRLSVDPRWPRRAQIIEQPFAQIKQHDGFRRWTMWGLENVQVQWSLLCTALNLRVLYRRWKSGGSTVLAAVKAAVARPLIPCFHPCCSVDFPPSSSGTRRDAAWKKF
jgi:hypothetical protein